MSRTTQYYYVNGWHDILSGYMYVPVAAHPMHTYTFYNRQTPTTGYIVRGLQEDDHIVLELCGILSSIEPRQISMFVREIFKTDLEL